MKKLMEQLVKFGIVGIISFGIDFLVFSFVNYILGVHYLIASFFGFTISVIANYLLSMKYVFERKEDLDRRSEFVIFVVLSVVGLILNEIFIYACVDGIYMRKLALQKLISVESAEFAGKIIATGLVMIYNFISRKIFLEKKR